MTHSTAVGFPWCTCSLLLLTYHLIFFVIPAYGAGVPVTTGLKGRVPAAQGFREKYRKPHGARKIFPRNPKKEHGLPLPVVMETPPRYDGIFFVSFLLKHSHFRDTEKAI